MDLFNNLMPQDFNLDSPWIIRILDQEDALDNFPLLDQLLDEGAIPDQNQQPFQAAQQLVDEGAIVEPSSQSSQSSSVIFLEEVTRVVEPAPIDDSIIILEDLCPTVKIVRPGEAEESRQYHHTLRRPSDMKIARRRRRLDRTRSSIPARRLNFEVSKKG